ncbi:MAG: tRNA nuclease CdiA-2 [Pseudomonas fluorescens]|nr:MAG: tRNA nuclease CdiA-2 [Pseudomonas fluorescens]
MNKHLYRIVFNKARGLLMVVAENVTGTGKAPGTTRAASKNGHCVALIRPLRFALMISMGWVTLALPAHAQVIADGQAPAGQRPGIGAAGNGTPVVDITAPSAAGVSRNTYQQFDVDKRGVILNNGATNSQTQLAGWIEGNRALANGSARVILNEVNSSNPSQLRGFVEVAGSKAQVVIANPSGIACDGCGFINADRATLTTGRAQFDNGQIKGYQVTGGKVSIGGAGLDASRADYTEIIARTVEVNAGIWSRNLTIKTGTTEKSLAPADPETPTVAIDVAQLGGMYAGKITLVGNGAGVGVRNAGQIGSSAGDVVISADGRIENRGQISSAGQLGAAADKGLDNSGTLFAQGDVSLTSAADIDNSGIVSARGNTRVTVTGSDSAIRSHAGSALAAGVDSNGKLGDSGSLTLTSAGTLSAKGQNLAAGQLDAHARQVDLSDSQTSANTITLTSSGDLDLRRSRTTATGALTAAANRQLLSDAAQLGAAQINVTAQDLSNQSGKWVQTGASGLRMNVSGHLDNTGGQITSNAMLNLEARTLDNTRGTVAATQTLTVKGNGIRNQGGTLGSVEGDLVLSSGTDQLDNSGGRLETTRTLALDSQGLNNRNGVITAGQVRIDTRGQQLDNRQGTLNAGDTLRVDSGAFDNDSGIVQARSDLLLDTHGQQLSNRNSGATGGILGQGDVTLRSGQLLNEQGFIGSARTLEISARQASNTGGLLRADGQLVLAAATLDNSATQGANQGIKGQSVSLEVDTLTNRAGSIAADTSLTLTGSGNVENQQGILSAGGVLTVTDRDPAHKRQTLSNSAGTLIGGQSLQLDSARYSGDGKILSLGDLTLRVTDDWLHTGTLQANGNVLLETGGQLANQGSLQAGSLLRLNAMAIDNAASGLISARQVNATAAATFDNRGLIDGETTRLQAATLNNLGTGRLYDDHLSIAAGTLNNLFEGSSAATIAARDRLDLAGQLLNNREHALIFSAGDLVIGSTLDANGNASGQAQALNNASATVEALANLTLNAGLIRNTNEHFATEQVLVSRDAVQEFQLSGSPNRYTPSQVSTYNDEVQHLVTPEGVKDNWNRYDYTRQVTETRIVSSDPGQILAGANLTLTAGQVVNDKSRIIAGQALTANAGSLVNTEVSGERVTVDNGTLSNFYRIQRKGRDRQGTSTTRYTPAPLIQQIALTPTVFSEYAAINGSGTQVGALLLTRVTQHTAGTGDLAGAGRTGAVTPISQVEV